MKKLIILFAVFALTCGCAMAAQKAPDAPGMNAGSDAFALAQDTVGKIFDAYRNYSRGNFETLVAPDVVMRSEFIDNIERDFSAGPVIEMNYFINGAEKDGNTLAVKVKWEKKTQPFSSSKLLLSKGAAELTFKQSGNTWLLYQITGDDPF